MYLIDTEANFCFLPGNDCDHEKISNISANDLKKSARRFKMLNIKPRIIKPVDALKGKPFRSNNNVPMGHRIY